jgi:branched-chain amino acid transport system substrate-binding protein
MPSLFRVLRRLGVLAAGIGLLAAAPAAPSGDPYDVYVLLPLSGSVSFYATAQQQTFKAIEAEANRTGGIGGRPLHFVIQDDQSDPRVDVQLASGIIAKNVPVILGPTNTAQCNAVSALVKVAGPVIYCFTPGVHPAAGSYTFSFGAATDYVVGAAFHYLAARGITRIATITSTDASGQDGDRMVDASMTNEKGLTLVDREHFNPTDVSVSAQLTRIRAANPQVLVAWTTGTPFGTVLRAVQESGLDVPVLTTNGNYTWAQFAQYKDILPDELLIPAGPFNAPEQYKDKGQRAAIDTFYSTLAAQGAKPDWGHNNCWDPAMIVVSALKKFGPNATADQIKNYIANLQGFPGVNGSYDFKAEPQRGLDSMSVVMVRWDKTKGALVPVSRAGGNPLH